MITAYFFNELFRAEILAELQASSESILYQAEGLLVIKDGPEQSIWAQQVWKNCRQIEISSIGDAAKKLKAEKGKWIHSSVQNFRRGSLIAEQVSTVKDVAIGFLDPQARGRGKAFCLIENNSLLLSDDVFPAQPYGQVQFKEDKSAPSRAYLKLWELFSVYGIQPEAGELCLDLGSSPGGWTWVLSSVGCRVLSVDKAPLEPTLSQHPLVTSIKKDAFALDPLDVTQQFGKVDWLFSDIICDPKRLLFLVNKWLDSEAVRNFACSVKFKGKTDLETLNQLMAIKGSKAKHLFHNKHEVTWYLMRN